MERPAQSFGQQAAKFSLYAPILVIVIGFAINSSKQERGVAISLAVINVILILAGFFLGIAALISMKRFGRRGILGRALIGVALNGLFLFGMVSVFLPLMQYRSARASVVGPWRMQSSPVNSFSTFDVTFADDGTFQINVTTQANDPITGSGTWVFTRSQDIGITVKNITSGDPEMIGKPIGLGRVETVDERQLVLMTDKGPEVFTRLP